MIKKIEGDGNCFYRTLSYYFRGTEDDHNEFRALITVHIINNPDDYITAVTDDDIDIPQGSDEAEIFNLKRHFINN